jgi:DNA-binding MarR family transcriptional regulator
MGKTPHVNNKINTHQLIVMMSLTQNAIQKIIRREIRKLGLTPEQGAALIGIYVLGNSTTAAELSRFSFREPASTTIILKRLESQGLISRKVDTKRKNISRISLTPKGYKLFQKAVKIRAMENVVHKLSEEKLVELWTLLGELKKHALINLKIDMHSHTEFFEKLSHLQ